MRFGICFCCNGDGKPKKPEDTGNTGFAVIPIPHILTEQPKSNKPIHLDEANEVLEDTSIPRVKQDEAPSPVAVVAPYVQEDTPSSAQSYDRQTNTPSSAQFDSSSVTPRINVNLTTNSEQRDEIDGSAEPHLTSSLNVNTTINNGSVTMNMLAPGYFSGTYNGYQFSIQNGELHDDDDALSQVNKELIMKSYSQCIEKMQKGVLGMQAGVSALGSSMSAEKISSPPVGTVLNINFTTRDGKPALMPLTTVGPGHFRGQYNGKNFTILNGELLTDGADDDLDRETILFQYNMTMKGMEQGKCGMQLGMLQMQKAFARMEDTAEPQHRLLQMFEDFKKSNNIQGAANYSFQEPAPAPTPVASSEPLAKRMRTLLEDTGMEYLKQDQYLRILQKLDEMDRLNDAETVNNSPPKPQHRQRFDDIPKAAPRNTAFTPNSVDSKKDLNSETVHKTIFDMKTSEEVIDADIDIPEPEVRKTTFTPNAVIYDDPKTYEEMDSYETPPAKRADEYIISLDDNDKAGNRYYSHLARPKRVTRPKLSQKQLLQIASPEKYDFFKRECLKAHNEYRAMHGVPPLVHSEFLSQYAREWAEHLALKDDMYHRPKNEYGENLYRANRLYVPGKKAVTDWYDEIDLYDYNNPFFSKEVGHFTQVVWKDTREVGTGVAQLGEKIWVCCNYHPPGNHGGKFNDIYVPRPLVERVPKS